MAEQRETDPLDTLLSLEEQYYAEGHALGTADGSKAGRIEGRIFGLQKGFEKFAAMGDLAGQSAVWEARMRLPSPAPTAGRSEAETSGGETGFTPPIQRGQRLEKHVATLAALTELASLDTQNTEDAISDFDDRLKRAEGKAKIIASIVGDGSGGSFKEASGSKGKTGGDANMEDFTLPRQARG